MCQYNGKKSPENGSIANYRSVAYIKYTPHNRQCPAKNCYRPIEKTFDANLYGIKSQYRHSCMRLEILTAVIMKNAILWSVTPCSMVEIYYFWRGECVVSMFSIDLLHAFLLSLLFDLKMDDVHCPETSFRLLTGYIAWQPRRLYLILDIQSFYVF
jgi:hypothetical protein